MGADVELEIYGLFISFTPEKLHQPTISLNFSDSDRKYELLEKLPSQSIHLRCYKFIGYVAWARIIYT